MLGIYDVFASDFTATIIVFLILLVLIAFIVARKNSISVFAGLGLIIVSLFSGPFAYLKKAVLELSEYRAKRKSESVPPKQVLLYRFFVAMQALLVVFAVALLATGLVSAWNQLVPSRMLRDSIGATEDNVKKLNAELPQLAADVKQMESLWSSRSDSLVASYNARRNEIAAMSIDPDDKITNRINSFGDTAQQALNEIKNYHSQNDFMSEAYQFEPAFAEIVNYIQRQNLSPDVTRFLTEYNDLWYTKILARFETRTLSEDQVKFAAYPAFHNRQQRLEYVKATVPEQEKTLTEMRGELSYNFEAFGTQIVVTLVEFMVLIWLVGLIIEWMWLGIEAAANVRKLRENSEGRR